MADYRIGRVKWFHPPKGYGFIIDATDTEVFVHYTALKRKSPGWRGLWRGEYVEFQSVTNTDGQEAATEVRGVQGGPLMCEASVWTMVPESVPALACA